MTQGDPRDRKPARAELAAQRQALEERRDLLLEQMAARRSDRACTNAAPGQRADPARLVRAIDAIVASVQQPLDTIHQGRDALIAERTRAEQARDEAGVAKSSMMLEDMNTILGELTESIDQLKARATSVRAAVERQSTDHPGANEPLTPPRQTDEN